MREILKQLGLIRESKRQLNVSINTFLNFFSGTIGYEEEMKIFGKPKHLYFGYMNESNFEITGNVSPFGNNSGATITGFITQTDNGIEVQMESRLWSVREYLFSGFGIVMFIGGIIDAVVTASLEKELLLIPLFGLVIIGFTFVYVRSDVIRAIKNFEKKLTELQEQNDNTNKE